MSVPRLFSLAVWFTHMTITIMQEMNDFISRPPTFSINHICSQDYIKEKRNHQTYPALQGWQSRKFPPVFVCVCVEFLIHSSDQMHISHVIIAYNFLELLQIICKHNFRFFLMIHQISTQGLYKYKFLNAVDLGVFNFYKTINSTLKDIFVQSYFSTLRLISWGWICQRRDW